MQETEPTLEHTLSELGEPVDTAQLADGWDESMRTLPTLIPFLAPAEIRHAREYCGLEPAVEEPLIACAGRIAANLALRRLAWHTARRLYEFPDYADFSGWPELRTALGEG